MTRRLTITSTSNDRLKAVRRLRRRGSRASDLVCIDGYRQLSSALEAGTAIREVYAAPALFRRSADAALVASAERAGARVCELTAAAFSSIASGPCPDGIAAVVERRAPGVAAAAMGERPLLLVCEAIARPGNLGTMIRTACAGGATGVVVCEAATSVVHPETVRASVGALFGLAVAETSTETAVRLLRRRGIAIVVATPGGGQPYWELEYTGPVAIVVGGERYGASARWLAAADHTARIPMPGPADSLNVAVAAGIVLFEATRQRADRAQPEPTMRTDPDEACRTRTS